MAVCADNCMIFLEILRLMNTSRWREVKERVDPLTKYNDSEFHSRFHLSELTIYHLLSDIVCQTVHLPSFHNIIRSVYCKSHRKSLQLWMTLEWRPSGTTPCGLHLPATARDLGWLFTNVCRRPMYDHVSVMSDFYILTIKSEYCNYFRLWMKY